MELGKISWTQNGWMTPRVSHLQSDASVLFFSDIDDTFVPWKSYNKVADTKTLARTRETLQNFEGATVNGLCSARGLSSVQSLLPYLKGAPLQFIGTNGGQQVYVNHDNLPTEEWLTNLGPSDRDYMWDREVSDRSGGFSVRKAQQEMKDALAELGFERSLGRLPKPLDKRDVYIAPLPGRSQEVAVVALSPDQTSFMVRANPRDLSAPITAKHRELARQLAANLEARMADQGIEMQAKRFISDDVHQIYLVEPKNVDKQALLEHLLERYPSVQAVITAGDHVNDTMLAPSHYGGVENFRIVSGNRPEVTRSLTGQSHVEQVPKGDLGPAIESHLARLLPEEFAS